MAPGTLYLKDDAVSSFVEEMMVRWPVVAPVAKRKRFTFEELTTPDEIRLDYDTTILPPKKLFFPTLQPLLRFDKTIGESVISPRGQVLFGVHPHDVKAIDMADTFYSDHYSDNAYLVNRHATTLVSLTVQNHYRHAFFGTVCRELEPKGQDLWLTRVTDGYVLEIFSEKGDRLADLVNAAEATADQTAKAESVKKRTENNCPEKLNHDSASIRKTLRESFHNPGWKTLSEDCFSCGSCNTVCPTCFCFDVQDEWNLDGVSGTRYRTWDGCLLREFSEVSVQGGTENFRPDKADRFRHRFLRKTAYLNDQLGGPACVGCGRCSGACTADIANPTKVINTLMES